MKNNLVVIKSKKVKKSQSKELAIEHVEEMFHSLYLVIYKVGHLESNGFLREQISDYVTMADSIPDALNKFAAWANNKSLTTYDIYAVDLFLIAQKYSHTKRLENGN